MREFSGLDTNEWQQIATAANGHITGVLRQWHSLQQAIDKTGLVLPGDTPARELKWVCEALYWQHRSDEHSVAAGAHAEAAHKQEVYTQELFAENERLKTENNHLREALKLEAAYAARPDVPLPQVLAGPLDKPE